MCVIPEIEGGVLWPAGGSVGDQAVICSNSTPWFDMEHRFFSLSGTIGCVTVITLLFPHLFIHSPSFFFLQCVPFNGGIDDFQCFLTVCHNQDHIMQDCNEGRVRYSMALVFSSAPERCLWE